MRSLYQLLMFLVATRAVHSAVALSVIKGKNTG